MVSYTRLSTISYTRICRMRMSRRRWKKVLAYLQEHFEVDPMQQCWLRRGTTS